MPMKTQYLNPESLFAKTQQVWPSKELGPIKHKYNVPITLKIDDTVAKGALGG